MEVTLGQMIKDLGRLDEYWSVPFAFCCPHSNRGWYEKLGLEVRSEECCYVNNVVKFLSECCEGRTFEGYKGGSFYMGSDTEVCLSIYGSTGLPLTPSFWNAYIEMIVEGNK